MVLRFFPESFDLPGDVGIRTTVRVARGCGYPDDCVWPGDVGTRTIVCGQGMWVPGRLCVARECGYPDDSAGCGQGTRRETHLGRTGATLR